MPVSRMCCRTSHMVLVSGADYRDYHHHHHHHLQDAGAPFRGDQGLLSAVHPLTQSGFGEEADRHRVSS